MISVRSELTKEERSGALSLYPYVLISEEFPCDKRIDTRKSKRKKEMVQLMFAFLFIVVLAGGLGFLSGFLTGKCYERRNIENLMEYYYNLSEDDAR